MFSPGKMLLMVAVILCCFQCSETKIFIDTGNPYTSKPLSVGQLTLTKSIQGAPMHTTVFFPVQAGEYPPIFFVGGLNGLVPAELYEDVQTQIAQHGFVVFGVDPEFPLAGSGKTAPIVDPFFQHLDWLRNYMHQRTLAVIAWNYTVMACHSSGCDVTLQMIQHNHTVAQASVFLEPFSAAARDVMKVKIPILSYGTELSEKGFPQCAIAGFDWRQFYKIFSCPKILVEVKGFGHCDILDPVGWQACHDIKFCKTTDDSRNADYRRFVQGLVSAFLAGTLENHSDSLAYILNSTLVPFDLLDLRHELQCEG